MGSAAGTRATGQGHGGRAHSRRRHRRDHARARGRRPRCRRRRRGCHRRHSRHGVAGRRHQAILGGAGGVMKVSVVGGGIIGCATAWELARAGCAVTLFERATPGAEASSAAAGILAPLGDSPDSAFARLALASWRLYPALTEELRDLTGIDVEYVTRGTIYPLYDAADVRREIGRAHV